MPVLRACAKSCRLGVGYVKERKQRACCDVQHAPVYFCVFLIWVIYLAI